MSRGVSLVEMLVALALFAAVGAAGYGTLDAILRVRDRTEDRLAALTALDRAVALLAEDLSAAIPGSLAPAEGGLALARLGPAGARPLVWVREGDVLVRRAGELRQEVLTGVAGWRLRYLAASGWVDTPGGAPRAVEAELTVDLGTVTRLVDLPR